MFKKTCFDLTSLLPKKKLNGSVQDVNELIILSEFAFFFFETNDINHTGKRL